MIQRITITDDEEGDFIWERDSSDLFKWRITSLGSRPANIPQDGSDVLWQIATSLREGLA
jgi:hypothetical protein